MQEVKFEKYNQKLWGKIELLHERYKRKKTFINNFKEIITKFGEVCQYFTKTLQITLDKNYQLLNENNTSLFKAMEKLTTLLSVYSQGYNQLFTLIKTTILPSILKLYEDLFSKEKEYYNSYKSLLDKYNKSKLNLDKTQKDYINSFKTLEKMIKNAKLTEGDPQKTKEEKDKKYSKIPNYIQDVKIHEEKYNASVQEAEKIRAIKNEQEKIILNYYEQMDNFNFMKVRELILIFMDSNNGIYNTICTSLTELNNAFKDININNDIDLFLNNINNDNKPDTPIKFIPYEPTATLKTESLTGDENETKNLILDYEIIRILKKYFKNICQDLNMEEEKKKNRLRVLSLKIFQADSNNPFTKDEKAELISLLNNPEYRNYFIINTSKQRTKSRYQRDEKVLDDLGDIFNIILCLSEKENNYEEAKNCIIISQTFYAELIVDNKKYKKYLFEYIIDNKWLTSVSFWEGIIDISIKKELEAKQESNKEAISKENETERKERISNICFSHMLPLTNNMIEFFMKKDVIKKTVDLFVKKYDIDEKNVQMIYDNIENTPKPPLPLSKRKKKKEFEKKRAYSYKYIEKKNIDFEKIEEKTRNSSMKKYKTHIKLENYYNDNNNLKLNNKNEIIDDDDLKLSKKESFNKKKSDLMEKAEVNKKFISKKTFDDSKKNNKDDKKKDKKDKKEKKK